MRRFVLLSSLAAAIAACGLVVGVTAAGADPGGGAIVFHSCPDTSSFPPAVEGGFEFNFCFDDTVTPSGKANASFHGSLVDPTTAPSKATTVSGFGCEADYPGGSDVTTDVRMVVTPSGQINGTCKFH